METKKILTYLTELEAHNNREWFHENKKQYQEAQQEFYSLIQQLILRIGEHDPDILLNNAKDLTFKLMRDTRFSHDKSPYNPTFRAHISSAGKLPIPVGYYLFIRPGNRSYLGGGLFASMFKDATKMVRDYIVQYGDELETIIHHYDFSENFTIKGEALKNVPKGYDATHPQAEFLKNKSWYIEFPISDDQIEDAESFLDNASDIFLKMRPFNQYLNQALEGFQMPKR